MAAIIDSAGNLVVEYKYDAWGNITHMFGSLASTLGEMNPFRYRGYVYDVETGLYYLRSRYFNPAWGRFINADTVLGKVGALGTHNLFAYCANNPVIRYDPTGHIFAIPFILTSAMVVTAAAFVSASTIDVPAPGSYPNRRPNSYGRLSDAAMATLATMTFASLFSIPGTHVYPMSDDNNNYPRYYLAVATGTGRPVKVSGPIDEFSVSSLLHEIYDTDTAEELYRDLAADSGIDLPDAFVYGVITENSDDAAIAASYFGEYNKCTQKLVGGMLPHYHAIYFHKIHFWYGG